MFTGDLRILAVVQVTYDISSVCLKHRFMERYAFLMADLFCADLTDQVLEHFGVADLRHRVVRKVTYSVREKLRMQLPEQCVCYKKVV